MPGTSKESSTERSKSASSGAKSRSRSRSSRSRSRSRSCSSDHDGYRLHIADIGLDVRKSDLEKVFAPYGALKEVWMTNSTPCFGFAVYKEKKSAAAALKACDGVEVLGTRIRVSYARPRTRGSGRRSNSTGMRCYQCGYNGHFYRDCPELKQTNDRRDRDKDRFGRNRSFRNQGSESSSRKRSRRSSRHEERSSRRRRRRSSGGSRRRR